MIKPPLLRLIFVSYHMMVTLLRGLMVVFALLASATSVRARVYTRVKGLKLASLMAVLLAIGVSVFGIVAQPRTASATAQNTLNFQARLQTNPGGGVVADGTYNLEFKLYDTASSTGSSQGSCTGDVHCLWTETYSGGSKVRVAHGYLTVNLGSLTAFPSTINWDQSLYITMNVGGTGTPGWNGEMSPRLALTAVPYAFGAAQLTKLNNATGFRSTLDLSAATGGDQHFILPDVGAAGTYTLLTTGNAIQNTTVSNLQSGNIAIQSAADNSVTAYFQGRTNQTADLIQLKLGSSQTGNAINIVDSSNNPLFKIASTGVLTQTQDANFSAKLGIGTTATSGVQLQVVAAASNIGLRVDGNGTQSIADFRNGSTSVATIGNTGQTTLQNSSDSLTAFNVKKSAGAGGASVLDVDTQNGRVGVGNATPGYTLDVAGDLNLSSGSVYRINGTSICTASGCTAASGSGSYIQNGTSLQSGGASFAIQSAADGNVTGYFEGRANQTADLVKLKLGSSQSGNAINIIDGSNSPLFKVDSLGVVTASKDVNASLRLGVGGNVASGIQLKVAAAAGNVGLQIDGNGTQNIADLRNGSTSVVTVGNTGQSTFQNSSDSATALNVKKSAGAGGGSVLDVDTQNGRVGVNNAAPSYALDVTGSVNVTTGNSYKIAGTDICTASGCTASAASAIQNGTSLQSGGASFAIQSAADGNVTGYFEGRTNQTADLVKLKLGASQSGNAINIIDGSNNPLFKIDSTGVLTQVQDANFSARLGIGTTVASGIQLKIAAGSGNVGFQVDGNGTQGIADFRNGSTSVATIGNTGQTTLQNSSDSATALNVKKSAGAGGTSVFDVDTQNGRVGINNAAPGYALDVTGSVNVTTGNTYKIAGTDICTSSGCTASAASAIQNTTTPQTNASLAISSAADANITAFLQGRTSQSADLLQLKLGSSQSGNAINIVDSSNNPLFKIANTGVLTQVQDANFSAKLGIGTTATSGVQLKVLAVASNIGLQVDGNGTQDIASFRNGSTSVVTVGNTGQTTFQNSANSASALTVKKTAASGGANVLNVDTQNGRVNINNSATNANALDVGGDINADGAGSVFKINGTTVCTINGCIPQAGNNRYIQNTTTLQTGGNSFAIQAANDSDITGYIEGRTSQSGSLLQLKGGSSQTGDYIKVLNSANANVFNINSSGNGTFSNNLTVSGFEGIGVAASAGAQLRITPATTTTIGLLIDGTSSTAGTSVFEANTTGSGSLKYNGAGTLTLTTGTSQTANGATLTLAATTGTQTNGFLIDHTGAGTTTNGFNINNTAGTLSNGIAFGGTIGADINRGTGTLIINGAGGISFKTNGTQTFSLTATGDALFKNTSDSATAFIFQDSGGNPLLTGDTTVNKIQVGSSTTDTTAILLVLDSYSTLADPTGVEGAMYYNTNSKSFRCYMNARWRGCVAGVVFANTTVSNSVSGTTAETAFNQTYSIPANDCQPGRVYRVTAQGLYSQSSYTVTVNLRLKFGTTVLAATGANPGGFGNTITSRTWRMEAQITCITTGASGTVEPAGIVTMFWTAPSNTAAFSQVLELRAATPTSPVTVDTTAAQTLQVSAQMSSATAGNTINMRQIVVEASGP